MEEVNDELLGINRTFKRKSTILQRLEETSNTSKLFLSIIILEASLLLSLTITRILQDETKENIDYGTSYDCKIII